MTHIDVRRLGPRARAQIDAALAVPDLPPARPARRRPRTTDNGSYRCHACGAEFHPGERAAPYTRAEAHADAAGHHRLDAIL